MKTKAAFADLKKAFKNFSVTENENILSVEDKFFQLTSIDLEIKKSVGSRARELANHIIVSDIKVAKNNAVLRILFFLAVIFYVFVPIVYFWKATDLFFGIPAIALLFLQLVQIYFAIKFLLPILSRLVRLLPRYAQSVGALPFILFFVLPLFWINRGDDWGKFWFFIFAGQSLLFVILFFYGSLRALNKLWLRSKLEKYFPDALLFSEVTNFIFELEQRDNWSKLAGRQETVQDIEKIAYLVDYSLPRSIDAKDSVTTKWFSETTLQIAAHIREQKKYILIPAPKIKDNLQKEFSRLLTALLLDDFMSIPRIEVPSRNQVDWSKRVRESVKILLMAAVPLGFFFLSQQIPGLQISSPYQEYVFFAMFSWVISTIMSSIDPMYATKVGIINDSLSALANIK